MAEEEVVVQQKGSNVVLILVIALLLVILIIGSAIIYLVANGPSAAAAAQEAQAAAAAAPAGQVQAQNEPKKGGGASAEIGALYPLEPFTANLSGEGNTRYLKISVQLEQNVPELTPELDKKKAVIRDVILDTLTSKSFEEINSSKGKSRLKEDLIQKINERLNDGFIKNVFFTEFVVS